MRRHALRIDVATGAATFIHPQLHRLIETIGHDIVETMQSEARRTTITDIANSSAARAAAAVKRASRAIIRK